MEADRTAATKRRKPTKADLAAALQQAEQALFTEPGAYTVHGAGED